MQYPEFENAVTQFRVFLASERWPSNVVWVRPGEVMLRRRRLMIREPDAEATQRRAQEIYAEGARRQFGVCLEAVGRANERRRRVARPTSADAASRLLYPNGLKLSAPTNDCDAEVVSGSWRWSWVTRSAQAWPTDLGDIEA